MDTLTAPRTPEVDAQGGLVDTRSWPALAAWGSGLVQLALGAGAVTGEGGGLAIRMAGILLSVIGAAAIGWGAATLARGRIVVPRVGVVGSLAGILISVAAMALDPTRVSVFAVAASLVLAMAAAFGCARALRQANRQPTDAGGRRVIGLVVGAVLVAALVTPALAATEAGQHAVPHGEMVEPGHH